MYLYLVLGNFIFVTLYVHVCTYKVLVQLYAGCIIVTMYMHAVSMNSNILWFGKKFNIGKTAS